MKKLIGLLIFVGLIVLLISTCPDKKSHTEALSEGITEVLSDKLQSTGIQVSVSDNPILKGFFSELGASIVDVDNYFIFSLGKINLAGEEQVVSFGICGHVFTFNDKIVQQAAGLVQKVKDKF